MLLTSALAIALAVPFFYLEAIGLHVVDIHWSWLAYVGVVSLVLFYAFAVTTFRKFSSLLHLALLLAVCVPLEFFMQAHFRNAGRQALWNYVPDAFLGHLPPLVQFVVGWTLDAIVLGSGMLWLSRLVAPLFRQTKSANPPTEAEYKNLFAPEWSSENVAKPKRDAAFYVLRIVGLIYIGYFGIILLGALGSSPYPAALRPLVDQTYENVPLAINTYVKLILMFSLATIAAYNPKLRFHSALAMLAGHLVSTVASLFFYFQADPASYLHDARFAQYHQFLMLSAIADSFLAILFIWVMIRHKEDKIAYAKQQQYPEFYSLPNRLTVIFFYAFGAVLATGCVAIVAIRLLADGTHGFGAIYGFPDPQICNTLTMYSTLAWLSIMIARRELLRNKLYSVLVTSFAVSVIASVSWLAVGPFIRTVEVATRTGGHVAVDWYFMLHVATSSLAAMLLLALRKLYYNVDYSITTLSSAGAQNVMGFHGALHGDDPEFDGIVLQAVDRQAANIRGRKRGLLNLPFALVEFLPTALALGPNFSTMSLEERRHFLRTRLLRQPLEQRSAFIPELADLLFKIGTACHALVTLAHYNHIRSRSETGFVPSDARDRLQGELASAPPPYKNIAPQAKGPLDPNNFKPDTPAGTKLVAPRMVTPISEPSIPSSVDYLVIGSGAGGAVMAYRLACEAKGAKILVVERGPRYSPVQDFNDNEMEMVGKLYKEGGLQQTKRFDMMILQAECMGGTTVINNAVTFKMPQHVRDRWSQEFGINLDSLDSHYDRIASEINIGEISEDAINQRVAEVFKKGITGFEAETKTQLSHEYPLKANHLNMVGDGLCNIGNKRMRKRSMLETYIPWAESLGVQFLPETSAVRFAADGRHANAVLLRTDLGHQQWVTVNKAVVVAGGVLASSQFLLRSGVMKNVGQRLACNLALPAAFEFSQELRAYDGVQITLGALDSQNRAIFETYFNPPGAFSIALPYFFDEHDRIMQAYSHELNLGALVGSEPNGTLDPTPDVLNGRAFSWELGITDVANLKYALSSLARIGRHAGATSVTLPFDPGIRLDLQKSGEVERFEQALAAYPLGMSDLHLATAHPQGGNGMAGDSSAHSGNRVVDGKFRVDGFDNLFVADASLFPTGITVNPQWTIMAMSSMAAAEVLSYSAPAAKNFNPRVIYPTVPLPWLLGRKKARA
jgi:choline dehydrogenase-like flavoprotein